MDTFDTLKNKPENKRQKTGYRKQNAESSTASLLLLLTAFLLSASLLSCSDSVSSDKKVTFSGTVTLESETNKILRV